MMFRGTHGVLSCVVAFLCTLASTSASNHGEASIVSYTVDTTISSRFARTDVTVEVQNERDDCTALAEFALQLPLNARVTNMTMTTAATNCQKQGVVQEVAQAEQVFHQQAAQGQTAALLKAYDATQYGVRVALPPSGLTVIRLHLEELLHRYRGKVDFQVPIYPGVQVGKLTVDIVIQEPQSGVARFQVERDYGDEVDPNNDLLSNNIQVVLPNANRPIAAAHMELTNVPESGFVSPLPTLLRAHYDPGPLPNDGLLLSDSLGKCFVHLFNPDSLLADTGALPRNIVFVIDVSGSMSGQKMRDAQAAFAAIIDSLTSDDYFAIQTFASQAVQDNYGPFLATDDVKDIAREWVNNLRPSGSTNLDGAYSDAILQVESMQVESTVGGNNDESFVPVVVILTDGEPTTGEQNAARIARNVRVANNANELQAKIYGMAFGDDADYALLSGVSLQNGGRAVRIFEGYGDSVTQMEHFFQGELGTVIMTDVQVTFDGTFDTQTLSYVPVFAQGSEIVVRARGLQDDDMTIEVTGATTTATTAQGSMTWTATVSTTEELQLLANDRNECIQSFAHQKIAELMEFRDACRTLGQDQMTDLYPLYSLYNNGLPPGGRRFRHSLQEVDVCRAVQDQALQLALEAAVVWPGLTAMVTVDSGGCAAAVQDIPICVEQEEHEHDATTTEDGDDEGEGARYVTGAPTAVGTFEGTFLSTESGTYAATFEGTYEATHNEEWANLDDAGADNWDEDDANVPLPSVPLPNDNDSAGNGQSNMTSSMPPPAQLPEGNGGSPQVTPLPMSQAGTLGPTSQLFTQEFGETFAPGGAGYGEDAPASSPAADGYDTLYEMGDSGGSTGGSSGTGSSFVSVAELMSWVSLSPISISLALILG